MKSHAIIAMIKINVIDLAYLLPEIFLLVNVLLLTLYFSFGVGRYMHSYFFRVSLLFATVSLFLAFVLSLYVNNIFSLPQDHDLMEFFFDGQDSHVLVLNGYLAFNNYVLFFRPFIIFTAFICCLISFSYYKINNFRLFEYPIVIVISVIGCSVLIASFNLMTFYLAMELTSFCLYTLAASRYNSFYSVEAGIKYFIQGCGASSFYLFGSSLFFLISGNTGFLNIREAIVSFLLRLSEFGVTDYLEIAIFTIAIMLTLTLLLFKVAVVPYHYWIADVYEGSPMPITAFFSIAVKLTMSVALIKFLTTVYKYILLDFTYVFIIYGLLSVIVGSLAALTEQKVKRVFAFSSIGHSGYILLALSPFTVDSVQISMSYLIVYVVSNIVIFAFLLLCTPIKGKSKNRYIVYITDLGLLDRKNITLSVSFSIALLSFAGIPPFGGFFVKFAVFSELWNSGHFITVIILVVVSIISAFYYLRLIKCLFFSPEEKAVFKMSKNIWNTVFILIATCFLIAYPFMSGLLGSYLEWLIP